MAFGAGKLLITLGLALMAWTGYQALTYRENLRLTQQEFQSLPLPILLQLAAAAAVCIVGGLRASGEFKPIVFGDAPRPVVMRPQRIDFVSFEHKGRAFAVPQPRRAMPALSS